jgi:surface protein
MSAIFQNIPSFSGNLSAWNTSNVTNMTQMFSGTTSFNIDPITILRMECDALLYTLIIETPLCFTEEEKINIYNMLEAEDLYVLELLKQIILSKLEKK